MKDRLYDRVKKFFEDNRVSCAEAISQCDWVIENAYEFLEDLYVIIEADLEPEEDE